jgi:hypothetical protein
MIEKFKVDRKDNLKMLSSLKGELIEKKIIGNMSDLGSAVKHH